MERTQTLADTPVQKGNILVINTGSTTTKLGFYSDGTRFFDTKLEHTADEVAKYPSVMDQTDMRRLAIEDFLKTKKENILRILNAADSDIVDVKIQGNSLKTFHKSNPNIAFDFDTEESEGTKTLFQMMLGIINVIRNDRTLLMDGIDINLHPHLVEYIINLFNRSNHAQLIYTAHNTHLLSTDFQRRDQVYFVNKRDDGCSELYSLYDFKDFRDNYDMEKAYLQGRFDAIPYLSIPNI